MKTLKRYISLFVLFSISIMELQEYFCLYVNATEAEEYMYEGLSWKYNKDRTEIIITKCDLEYYDTTYKKVVIPNYIEGIKVTTIQADAFQNIAAIELPSSIKVLEKNSIHDPGYGIDIFFCGESPQEWDAFLNRNDEFVCIYYDESKGNWDDLKKKYDKVQWIAWDGANEAEPIDILSLEGYISAGTSIEPKYEKGMDLWFVCNFNKIIEDNRYKYSQWGCIGSDSGIDTCPGSTSLPNPRNNQSYGTYYSYNCNVKVHKVVFGIWYGNTFPCREKFLPLKVVEFNDNDVRRVYSNIIQIGMDNNIPITVRDYTEDDLDGFGQYELGSIKDIVISSVEPVRHMQAGESAELKVSLYEDGVIAASQGEFSFVVGDTAVVDISNIYTVDDGTMMTVTAKGNGTTLLTVTHNETGEKAYTTITVGERYTNNSADYVPQYNDHNDIYNYYESGMYVSDFKETELNDDYYKVSMNVYNSKNVYGALDVYNSNGQVVESVRIDKFDGGNLTSIKDTIGSTIDLVQDFWNGHILSFKNRAYSTATEVEVKVPKGGYIYLTNNVNKSDSCLIYNSLDIIVYSIMEAIDIAGADGEKLQDQIYIELMKAISYDNVKSEFVKAVKDEFVDKLTLDNAAQIISRLSGNSYSIIADLDIDWEEIITSAAKEMAVSIPEDVFKKLSGFAGIALDGIFKAGEYMNFVTQVVQTFQCKNSEGLRIDTKTNNGELVDNGIKVETQDTHYVLRTFQVEEEDTINQTEAALGKDDFVLYDIYMLQNDNVTQPTGTVKVSIPVPPQYTPGRLKVYRIEDGTKIDMNARVEGAYLVFETNHFSLYAVVEGDYIIGDVNGDGNIDTQDAVLLKKYLAGYTDLCIVEDACDVNNDGSIDSADAVILLKHLAGYDVGLTN